MGQSSLLSSIKYIQTTQDQHFGRIQVFQPLQNPAQYIFKYRRIHQSSQHLSSSLTFHQQFQKLKHRVLAKLYFLESLHHGTCAEIFQLNCYYSYYNITLDQIFSKRVLNESMFPESELWYILSSLLEVGEYLQDNSLALENYNMRTIFVTPGGFIKIYTTEIEDNHHHSCYYAVLKWTDSSHHILAPEQLEALKERENKVGYNVYKSDLFAIAIVMLQLMTLNEGRFYDYGESFIDEGKITYKVSELWGRGVYSKGLVGFVRRMLQWDVGKRWDFKEAVQELKGLRGRERIEMVKSIGADISVKRKSQNIISPLGETNVIDKLIVGPISSMVFKKKGGSTTSSTASMMSSRNWQSNKEN